MYSFYIDYKKTKTELCEIGKKYDTDKSSQRLNRSNLRHCHPYTIFYDTLFKVKKDEELNIGEIGILEGSSLLMWKDYFTKSKIYGFDNNEHYLNNFKEKYNNERITLKNMNIYDENSIKNTLNDLNVMYDIFIDDTTHWFDDQIRIIKNVYHYIKPGGVLIIESIFKKEDESRYEKELKDILCHFQDYFFITLEHENRISTGWDNDKLLVLIKGNGPSIFKNENKLTIITPSCRPNNLPRIYNNINFDYIDEWIIVYDESKIKENPYQFKNNEKVKEYLHTSEGISGNPQRNYGLSKINNPNTFLYYLDDDNMIHPNLYRLLNIIDKNKMYTFNQINRLKGDRYNTPENDQLKGDVFEWKKIDTAMLLIDYNLCKENKWVLDKYWADFVYINECYQKNKDNLIYVDNDLCYYNII